MGYQGNFFTRIRRTFTAMAVGVLLSVTGVAFAADTIAWDKIFPQSDKVNHEDRTKALEQVAEQFWNEFQDGENKYVIGTPESIAEDSPAVAREFYDYYGTKRGYHPRSTTAMSRTSDGTLMNFFQSVQASEPKELYIVSTAGHVDLYDQLKYIPFDKLTSLSRVDVGTMVNSCALNKIKPEITRISMNGIDDFQV